MGHLEPGGAAGAARTVGAQYVWELWRRLAAAFGPLRTLRAAAFSKASFGFYGVDFASSLRRTPMTQIAAEILKDAPPDALEAVAEIAEINAQRNDAMWRVAVIFYVSVPVTLFLAAMEALPGFGMAVFGKSSVGLWIAVAALTLFLLYYMLTQWRARQILAALKLLMIERRLAG